MQCVSCGKETSVDQNFCRFCGTSLKTTAGVPLPNYGISESDMPLAKVTTRIARRRMNRLLLWGLIVIGLGITLLANAQDYQWLNWLGIAVFLAGSALAIYGVFSPSKALVSSETSQAPPLNQSKANLSLPSKDTFDQVPSVTERTTELLERKQPHSQGRSHGDAEDK